MSKARMKRIEKAQLRVMFTVPFFACGVAKLPVEFDGTVETACTNGEVIKMSPAFVDRLSDAELVTLLCHEVSHPLLGHLWRLPPAGGDLRTANIACDHAVNLMLKEFSAGVMAKNLADPFPFPAPHDAYCADPQFKGLAEEVIYNRLASHKPPGGLGGSQGKGGAGKAAHKGSQVANSKLGAGSMPSFGQFEPGKGAGKVPAKQLQNQWASTLLQSAKLAVGQGNLPASISRLVDSIVNPRVPWQDILRSYLREQRFEDWSWSRPDLTFEGSGFILPSLYSEGISSVVFCIDTSGSVDSALLAQFKAEMANCLDEMRPSKLIEICADAAIQRETEYQFGDRIKSDAPGGGGTSFIPALSRCAEMVPMPKAVVYLTDGMGEYGSEPPFPVIWCMYGGCDKAPYGQIVQASLD